MVNKNAIFLLMVLGIHLILWCFPSETLLAQQNHSCQHNRNLVQPQKSFSADLLRSDTLDLLHVDLQLDMTQTESSYLYGIATLDIRSKMDAINWVSLDLEGLSIDSILVDGLAANFTHNPPLVVVELSTPINTGQEVQIVVYYGGSPIQDESGWGGFYYNSGYAFNLGVGFAADPHNYGRVWFPCFDNFVERSTFTMHVLTDGGLTSYCGGELIDVAYIGTDSILSHWVLDQPIPSYLASIAVGNYTHTEQILEGVSGETPSWLAAPAEDTAAVLNSFVNLPACFNNFENRYGPYQWPRVGFTFVPFSSGAMEHACNIAYPLSLAQGNLTYETLMAHELSHHWWGDLVTCKTQEDMWINEGMASYSESLFLEAIYGEFSYVESVRDNLKDVLLYAHIRDGERLPVSGIGHEYTYGDHVYNKGALAAHNLRTYMGDDFFNGLQTVTDSFAFQAIDSPGLRDVLQMETSANLNSFFDGWIFSPGFPEFRVKSFQFVNNQWEFLIEQQLHYAPNYFMDVPLLLTLRDNAGNTEHHPIMVSGAETLIQLNSNLQVDFAYLNADNGILYAVLDEEKIFSSSGIKNFGFAELRMDIETIGEQDSIWVRVENHWANTTQLPGQTDLRISSDRFWRIRAEESINFEAELRLRYYGNSSSSNYFDPLFFNEMMDQGLTEEDLVAVFRPLNSSIWTVLGNAELNVQGDATNFQGYLDIPWMGNGDYAWAYLTGETAILQSGEKLPIIYPNPTSTFLFIADAQQWEYKITTLDGSCVASGYVQGMLNIENLKAGNYVLILASDQYQISHKFQKID